MVMLPPKHPDKLSGAVIRLSAILLVLCVAVWIDRAGIFIPSWGVAELARARHESGFAYVAPTHRAELSSHETPSLAQVWEDGRPLPGPGNAQHEDIRELGRGRYSFWHAFLYFSASDNSDPATSGHHYQIFYPRMVGTVPAFCLYGLTVLALAAVSWGTLLHPQRPASQSLRQRLTRTSAFLRAPPFFAPASIVSAVFLITRLPFFLYYPIAGLAPDTGSYLGLVDATAPGGWPHFIIRTPGYPLFLRLVTAYSDRWISVISVQCLLTLAASLCLVYAVQRLQRSLALPAAVAMAAFLGSSQVLIYDTLALSDSLYTSCVIFSLAFLILALGRGLSAHFALASTLMASAILVRPAGMYLMVIYVFVLTYAIWNRLGRNRIISFAVPLPLVLLALCSYNYLTIQTFVISPFGEANLAGATLLYWEPDPSLPPFVNQALTGLPASYQRAGVTPEDFATLRTSWNPDLLFNIFSNYYNILANRERWAMGTPFHSGNYLEDRAYIRRVSLLAIKKHPDLYAKFVWANLATYFKGIKYQFDFYAVVRARALQNYGSADGISGLPYAKEYRQAPPPPRLHVSGAGTAVQVSLASTTLERLHLLYQFWHQKFFQAESWCWIYFLVLIVSAVRFCRSRGRHLGAFVLCLLGTTVLGASLVICLVEEAMDRYSYPTQFIYYLSAALLPLLWNAGWSSQPAEPASGR